MRRIGTTSLCLSSNELVDMIHNYLCRMVMKGLSTEHIAATDSISSEQPNSIELSKHFESSGSIGMSAILENYTKRKNQRSK